MDKSKIAPLLFVGNIRPVVHMANFREVPKGACWVLRTIPDTELILVVAGRFSYERLQHAPQLLVPGDVLFIPPGEHHTLRRLGSPVHAAFSCIHGELLPDADWSEHSYRLDPAPLSVTHTGSDAAIHDIFLRCSEAYAGYETLRAELLETLAKELWLRLAEYWCNGGRGATTERIRPMTTYLRDHLDERVGRNDLARVFRVTPEHVNALFRREFGVTPTQFLHRERIMRAYRHLRDEGLSVKETAARVGFEDPFYFSRVFRTILKRTPSSVRRS